MSSNKTVRVQWVDIIKFICIIFVMSSHLEAQTDFLSVFTAPFFLNGFFFASGYVYRYKDKFDTFLVKKIKGLLWPWFFFSLFNILLSRVLSFNNHIPLSEELKWNFLQIRGLHDGLWFIAALFVTFIPFYFFIKKYEESKKDNAARIVLLSLSFSLSFFSRVYSCYMNPNILPWGGYHLPWHIETVFVAMFWMVLGYLFKEMYGSIFDKYFNIISFIVVIIVCLLMIYIPFYCGYGISNNIINIFYSYTKECLAVTALIFVSKKIKPNSYNLFVGQNTIIYFALHGKVYSVLQTVIKKVSLNIYTSILSNTVTSSIFALLFAVVLSIVLIVPTYIINKFFPFLVGRKK